MFPEEPDEDEIMAEEEVEPPRSRRHSGARRRGDGSRSGRETFTIRIPSPQGLFSTRVRVATPDNPFLLHVLSGVDALQHDIRNYAWSTGEFLRPHYSLLELLSIRNVTEASRPETLLNFLHSMEYLLTCWPCSRRFGM